MLWYHDKRSCHTRNSKDLCLSAVERKHRPIKNFPRHPGGPKKKSPERQAYTGAGSTVVDQKRITKVIRGC
jgi:hypothetical protein